MNPIVIIPARLAATRLPNKPLADIAGRPMIAHVVERALAADIGPVAVAADSAEIAAALNGSGAEVVLTRPDHPSGSDRIFEALGRLDPDRPPRRGGERAGRPSDHLARRRSAPSLGPLADPDVAIATLAGEIVLEHERTNPNVVKVVGSPVAPGRLRALYFTRATAPWGEGPLYHHSGLYAYRRAALERFVGAAAERAGEARAAGAVAGARSRHADRRDADRRGAVRRRHAGRSGAGARGARLRA